MSMAKKIKLLLVERELGQNDLAERLGTSLPNLNRKLHRDNFSEQDLIKIADALDCDFKGTFVMRDTGKEI